MITNSEDSSTNTNNNLSEYELIWKRIRNSLDITAKDFVPQMYDALIKEGYTPKEARDRIKRDALNIWKPETIDKWIPIEAKQELKVLAGQQTNKTEREIQEVVYKDAARSDRAELASVPIEQEKKIVEEQQVSSPIITRSNIWNVPPTRTRKLFMDIMKVRNLMEKTGLKINLDTFDVDI